VTFAGNTGNIVREFESYKCTMKTFINLGKFIVSVQIVKYLDEGRAMELSMPCICPTRETDQVDPIVWGDFGDFCNSMSTAFLINKTEFTPP
jgi:hypothetical protein